jgi:hypothetical protein
MEDIFIMKNSTHNERSYNAGKRKLTSAVVMLLIACILLTGVTFAWLTLSLAPEVSGITTNVGANGALEIALLNAETRIDPSKIRTAVGQSLESGSYTANYTWGNLIDLSHSEFGLGEINLSPARLQITKNGDLHNVASSMLAVPNYGYDGRIIGLEYNTLSAIYDGSAFTQTLDEQGYGVRGIGTSSTVSAQAAALSIAKSNIKSYTESAKTTAKNALNGAGENLLNLIIVNYTNTNATYGDSDIKTIRDTLVSLERPLKYIEDALRYGLVAFAASEIADEDEFALARTFILNSESLSDILNSEAAEEVEFPSEFVTWVNALNSMQLNVENAKVKCDALSGGIYTWDQIKEIINYIINFDGVYIGDAKFENADVSSLIGKGFTMTLASGSGVFADIADFTGDYTTYISAMGSEVTVTTLTQVKPVYLAVLSEKTSELAAEGEVGEAVLSTLYGYAIDLAFRTNAAISNLLLQTGANDRLYEDGSGSTMGGGSYMEFSTNDKNFSFEQVIQLMDAIRVAFVDDIGNVYGIAKLNTSNNTVENGFVKAPLYLYGFSVSENEETKGALIMDERRKADNTITSLEPNTAKVVTAIVWLDGDIVDNTMVSAEAESSISGILNLQFASSADLIPAENKDLLHASPDKKDLGALVAESRGIFEAGQGVHTTVSWNNFVNAYGFANAVYENAKSNEFDVYRASLLLTGAKNGLDPASIETLGRLLEDVRKDVGQTDEIAMYVLWDEIASKYVSVNPYTMEQAEIASKIYQVDYDKNLRDEGNGVMTPIYTDASWLNLAAALYEAELVYGWNNKSFEDVDAAITALQAARDALVSRVYFIPYDYEGALYYYAIPGDPISDADTYGKWYNTDFKRVVSDLMILKLDSKAVKANIAQIVVDDYIDFEFHQIITPYVEILTNVYPELKKEDILAINWAANNWFGSDDEVIIRAITPTQITYLEKLVVRAKAVNIVAEELDNAQNILNNAYSDEYDERLNATEDSANAVISALEHMVRAAEEEQARIENEQHDPATSPMSSDQRYVLTAAVSSAKSLPGFDDVEKTELDSIRTEVVAVETLLAQETGITEQKAEEALAALNALIVEAGGKEVTAYNTILHTVPTGSEIKTVVNTVDATNANLYIGGVVGQTQFSAVVLTRNGIVIELSKSVTFYVHAEAPAQIHNSEDENISGTSVPQILVSGSALNAFLAQQTERAYITIDGKEYFYGEEIKECKWASSDSRVIIDKTDIDSCVITAEEEITAVITLVVETVQGNKYSAEVTVTVQP